MSSEWKGAQLPLGTRTDQALEISPGAILLRNFAKKYEDELKEELEDILTLSPPVHMETPGGATMSVAMSNCGQLGWTSSRRGYRYSSTDHLGQKWPAMPPSFRSLATSAASIAGWPEFAPDACLVNLYSPGSKLSLHQDKDERDFSVPIVSVSLGLPGDFLWGGESRDSKTQCISLFHGDVLVFGGPARMRFHGVLPIKRGCHEEFGEYRINLTFRQAG